MESRYLLKLEKRFGVVDLSKDIINSFGKKYSDGIIGWQFPPETIKEYNQTGKLLTMDLDIPGICKLNCIYCFARANAYYRPQAGERPLSLERIKKYLIEAKALGLESAKIIGYREPFENKELFDFIDFATANDIHLVIFTAAYTLGEEAFGGKKEKVVEFLFQEKVSLMIKFHTLDQKEEERIVALKGYPKRRDEILRIFLEHGGFNNTSPTRLGLENVIATKNVDELLAIYKYFKIFRNLHVDIDPPIPVGRTATKESCEKIGIDEENLLELYKGIYEVNQRFKLPFLGLSPFIGNAPCSQLSNGIYLTLSGKVMSCCGGNQQYGDVNEGESLKDIFLRNPYRLKDDKIYRDCPYRGKAGILSQAFLRKVKRAIK